MEENRKWTGESDRGEETKTAAAANPPCQRCKGCLLPQSTARLADGNKMRIIRKIYSNWIQSQILHLGGRWVKWLKWSATESWYRQGVEGVHRSEDLDLAWKNREVGAISPHWCSSFSLEALQKPRTDPRRATGAKKTSVSWTWPWRGRNEPTAAGKPPGSNLPRARVQ